MKGLDYLKDKAAGCICFLGVAVLAGMFQAILQVELAAIVLTELPFLVVFFLLLAVDYYKKKQFYSQLEETLEELDEKAYLADVVKEPYFWEGRITRRVLKQMGKEMNDQALQRTIELQEYKNYMETWVHEVKLPVATAKLMVSNHKNEVTLSIEEEIDKIDQYVEQVLYYARSENVEKDYHMDWFELKPLIYEVVKKYARELIQAKMRPEIGELNFQVLSDRKWIAFILGQFIQNAIKYRGDTPQLSISAASVEQQVVLCIEDNGMGISSEDLERVFDKGFTGENVRANGKATGIGLYLCKRLSEQLGLSIDIESELGQWTKVRLYFPKGKSGRSENLIGE